MCERAAGERVACTTAQKADGAVGVRNSHWFIAIVNNNSEKICAEKLLRLGYETYIPSQTETRLRRNGRRKNVERIVFPALVFIRTTEAGRRTAVNLPFIKRFMVNRAGEENKFRRHPIAVVPDVQMERLRFMLERADAPVSIEPAVFRYGDKVRVIRGNLAGLEGQVLKTPDGKSRIFVSLDILGCASVEIDRASLEIVYP